VGNGFCPRPAVRRAQDPRALTIVDTFTWLSPAIDVRQSFRGSNVVNALERVIPEVGCPKTIRLDNGPEFVSKELDLWPSCAA
jgi:putative transposase